MLSRALRTIDGGKCLGVNAPVVSAPRETPAAMASNPDPVTEATVIKSPVERAQDPRFAAATQEEAKMDAMRAAARKRIAGEADADPAAPVPDFDDLEPVMTSASSGSSLDAGTVIDTGAVWRYFLCTAVQFSVLVWFSMWLNVGLARSTLDVTYQKALVGVWFGFNALKSRVFSPLNATRPKMEGEKTAIKERRRPAWMPPPLAFPVIWTTIAVLRAVSSVVVFGTTGDAQQPGALRHAPAPIGGRHLEFHQQRGEAPRDRRRRGLCGTGVGVQRGVPVLERECQGWGSDRAVGGVDQRGDAARVHHLED
jgi:hypothetical protein